MGRRSAAAPRTAPTWATWVAAAGVLLALAGVGCNGQNTTTTTATGAANSTAITPAAAAPTVAPAPAPGGSYVDVTPTVTAKVEDRFGTQPSQRSGQTMVAVDVNTAVMFGGLTAGGAENDVWEYKLDTGKWTELHKGGVSPADSLVVTIPPPRVGHSAVLLKGDLWVFGGYDSASGDLNDLWQFRRASGTWAHLKPAVTDGGVEDPSPAIRSGHSAVAPDAAGSTFIVFGGNMRNDMWEYDTATGKWRSLMKEMSPSAAPRRGGAVHGVTLALGFACAALLWGGGA